MNFSWRKIMWLLAASLAVIVLWRPWVEDAPRDTIRVVVTKYLSNGPLFIALEEGFFAAEGLTVELLPITGTSTAIPALIRGEVDVLPAVLMSSYFNVIIRGGLMRVVASKGHYSTEGCAYSGIIARRSLLESGELSSPRDMAGRRLSIDRTWPSYYLFDRFMSSNGLTLDDMTVIGVTGVARIDALARGSLDISTAAEPWLTRSLRAGDSLLWSRASDHLPGFQFGFLLYGKTLLEDRPEVGDRFMLAYLKAIRHLNAEGKSHGHIGIVAKHTGLDRELLEEICWPPVHDDARVRAQGLDDFQHWAVKQGLVSQITPIELLYDSRYIERANRLLDEESKSK